MTKSIKDKILKTKRVFEGNSSKYINADVDTEDQFYILSANEVNKLPSSLKSISATDYAIANQAAVVSDHRCTNGKAATAYWTDSFYFEKGYYGSYNEKVKNISTKGMPENVADTFLTRPALAPAFNINVEDLKNSNAIINTNGVYPTVIFPDMQYPQTKVGDRLANELENYYQINNPKPSSWYMGSTTNGKSWSGTEKDYEYIYKGERYVRVVAESKGTRDMNFFEDGSTCEDGKVYWFKVEPIRWAIINWDTTSLNANANSRTTEDIVSLRSEEAILGGIPFFTKADGSYKNLWQNSYTRALLNGYNLREVIKKGNGNKSKMSESNYDFSNDNSGAFKEVVFKEEMKKLNKEVSVKKTSPFNLTVSTKTQNVDEQIAFYIENGFPFMLHGRSGIGKSKRVQEIDPDCVIITLRNGMLPEEINGKTAYNDMTGEAKWIEPIWYTKICKLCREEPNKNHVLFIDELTNVKEIEQSLVYNIVLEHTIEGGKGELPKNCIVVAAGNNPDESTAAFNMPEPLFRRFYAHIYLKPDVRSFITWGSKPSKENPNRPNVHPAVLSFIASRGKKALFTDYYDSESENPSTFAVDSRGWEQVSDILFANPNNVSTALIVNKIGKELAIDFLSFIQKRQITVEDIINDEVDSNLIPREMDSKYALALSLTWVDEKNVEKVRKFVKRHLGGEYLSYFDSAWAGDDTEKLIGLDGYEDENY